MLLSYVWVMRRTYLLVVLLLLTACAETAIPVSNEQVVISGDKGGGVQVVQEPVAASSFVRVLDRGVASNVETPFTKDTDFSVLHNQGIERVNLYFTWKELSDADDVEEKLDPIIAALRDLDMRASLVIGVAMPCATLENKTCWLTLPKHSEFSDWDQEPFASEFEDFVEDVVLRYDAETVTHVFVGNKIDVFLRRFPDHTDGFVELMSRLQERVSGSSQRSRLGSSFLFVPGDNDIAKKVADEVDVVGFSVHAGGEPTAELVRVWYDEMRTIASSVVVLEASYPSVNNFGNEIAQKQYVERILDVLSSDVVEFISWYALLDSQEHPEAYYHSVGLRTLGKQDKQAFDVWVATQ
jgi:hypothetical protein